MKKLYIETVPLELSDSLNIHMYRLMHNRMTLVFSINIFIFNNLYFLNNLKTDYGMSMWFIIMILQGFLMITIFFQSHKVLRIISLSQIKICIKKHAVFKHFEHEWTVYVQRLIITKKLKTAATSKINTNDFNYWKRSRLGYIWLF